MHLGSVLTFLRAAVLAATLFSLAIALTARLIRMGQLGPFNPWSRFIRRTGDPLVRWMERRVVRAGGDPRAAPWWLLILVVAAGLVLLSTVEWLTSFAYTVRYAVAEGAVGITALILTLLYDVEVLALIVRVVGSWFGMGRWNRWTRPAYRLTDWVVTPLARVIPTWGTIDVTPLAAWFMLWVIRQLLFLMLAKM